MKVDISKESPVIGKWKLIEVDIGEGILHPLFSKDGEKIVWSEIMTFDDNDPYSWQQAMISYENNDYFGSSLFHEGSWNFKSK